MKSFYYVIIDLPSGVSYISKDFPCDAPYAFRRDNAITSMANGDAMIIELSDESTLILTKKVASKTIFRIIDKKVS